MNSASTSTASLLPASSNKSPSSKNYQQAFGNLASSFGFSGSVVSAPTNAPQAASSSSSSRGTNSYPSQRVNEPPVQSQNSAPQQSQAAYWASQSNKNFEAAYGNLASTYGFNGAVPSPKPRRG